VLKAGSKLNCRIAESVYFITNRETCGKFSDGEMNKVHLADTSIDELRRLVRDVVQGESDELRKKVALLREERRHGRKIITHRHAIHSFDLRVTPETILEYIWWCELPSSKRGRVRFIQIGD